MSQILFAGGLAMMREYEHGEGSWWMAKNGPFVAPWNWTHSWTVADTLRQHLLDYGLARVVRGRWRRGDLVAYDWGPDGTYDHINFVYKVRGGEPYLLQHTPDYTRARSSAPSEGMREGRWDGSATPTFVRCTPTRISGRSIRSEPDHESTP